MQGNSIDLRWWLLSNLVGIESLPIIYRLLVILTFIAFIFSALSPLIWEKNRNSKIQQLLFSNLIFIVSLVAFILAARWPGFLPPRLNVDEAQFAAGAMKLSKDPVFWRAADGGSTGPLNLYPLTLPGFFGLRIEYASVRLIGLIFIVTAIICLYYAVNSVYGRAISRLAIIPVVTTVALMTYSDYVHYTSEHLSILLLSLALLIVCRYHVSDLYNPNSLIFSLGFVLGLIPYAKMQAVPIAFSIFCIFLHLLWVKSKTRDQFIRSLSVLVLGAMLFSSLVILYLTIFSLYEAFWKSYIQQNLLFYSTNGLGNQGNAKRNSLRSFLIFLRMVIIGSDSLRVLFSLTGIILITGIPFLIRKRGYLNPNKEKSETFIFLYYSLTFLTAAIYSVMKPGTGFTHYLLFLIVPSGFVIAVFVGELEKVLQRPKLIHQKLKLSLLTFVIAIIVTSSFFQVGIGLKAGNPYINNRGKFAENYISPVARTILKYASAGEFMAVWGWASELYVDTGIIQATRDAVSVWQIKPSPLQEYFLKRYAEDLVKSNARLFVDAVAPEMFFLRDRETEGYEAFPEIANIVNQNYQLVDEVQGVRIFLKR